MVLTTSAFKPCEDCGRIECNGECKQDGWEDDGGRPQQGRYRPAKKA